MVIATGRSALNGEMNAFAIEDVAVLVPTSGRADGVHDSELSRLVRLRLERS